MRDGRTGATRLQRVVPAGLLDAGFASLATLVTGLYAVRSLPGPELGAYALFFAAFTLAAVVPAQLVLIPAQNAAVREVALPARVELLDRTWRLGGPIAIPAAIMLAAVALLVAEGPSATTWALAVTTALCATVSPLQDHVRRTLHLSGLSWLAAAVSLVQLTCVLGYLAGLGLIGVPAAWLPFGALALANLTSLGIGSVPGHRRRQVDALPRHSMPWLMRSGRWLLGVEAATAGAMFVSSALVSWLSSPEDLGLAEAGRVVAQPVFVVAVGLAATLGPRLIESAAAGDEFAARRSSRPFLALVVAAGLLYGAFTAVAWPGNPLAKLVPLAYSVPLLVPATVLALMPVGMAFSRRSELVGGGRERLLLKVSLVAGLLQCVTTLTAPWTGAYARSLGVGVFGVALLVGFEHHRRAMYRTTSREERLMEGHG